MASGTPKFWGRKTFCVITGASQGIGREFAIEFGRNFGDGSLLVLLARSEKGLAETKRLVLQANPLTSVKIVPEDLSNPDPEHYATILQSSLSESGVTAGNFDLAMIVHNAGTIGDVAEKTVDMSDPKKWRDFLSLNLISMICLNSTFLSVFPVDTPNEKCIVNITSLCAIEPFKSMAHYCVGKASREMFLRVLALENPSLNVINYSPGPVDTEMQVQVRNNVNDPEVKQMFVSLQETGKILTTEQTTKRFIKILSERKYKSGDHIDYFDQNE